MALKKETGPGKQMALNIKTFWRIDGFEKWGIKLIFTSGTHLFLSKGTPMVQG